MLLCDCIRSVLLVTRSDPYRLWKRMFGLKLEKNKILSKFDFIRKLNYGSFKSHIAYIVRA